MSQAQSLDYRSLPSYKPLFLDYLHRFDALSPFFAADPFEPDSWLKVASALEARSASQDAATPLRALNEALGADEHALRSIDGLKEGALAVVTGQQVGLFGGPLYTLYKAMSAVRLARAAEEQLQKRVVPLFWMDTDDHDFAEVQNAWVLDPAYDLVNLRYEGRDDNERFAVGGRELNADIESVLNHAEKTLPETEFKQEVLAALRQSYAPGNTMARAFGSWLLRMTRGTGLAVVDPALPELKRIGAGVFEREIADGSESTRLVQKTTEELLALGYHAQASASETNLNLFYADPSRNPIAASADSTARDDWKRRAGDEPEKFSPNVLLRPIYQDTLFPTLAYVAGPNELAYFAQLKRVYEHFDVTMPLIASRASLTVIERAQARFLERYDVELVSLDTDDESVLNDIVRAQTPPQLDEDLSRARNCIQDIT
jgi:bacillithiol biosynthesis cysteine-adding enzyme BshC